MGVGALVKKVLGEVGIKPERFSLQWASAAEAPRFVRLITEFTRSVRELGPMGQAEGLSPEEVKVRLDKAVALVSDRKIRIALGNTTKTIRKEGKFTEEFISGLIEEKLGKTIKSGLEGLGV